VKSFHFSLQKALEWRGTQLELAEAKLQQQLAALTQLDRASEQLQQMGQQTEVQVRAYQPLAGADLRALGSFRMLVKSQQQNLAAQRAERQKEVAAHQAAMVEARRRCRLLERLKEKRWTEWQAARDKELEELASDSFLAQWTRGRSSL
jgi:hypothetical protein